MKIRHLLLAVFAIAGTAGPLHAQNFVSDIKAAPQRFWNRAVEIEGQVTAVQAEFPGSSKGQYILIDESDTDGILVRTKSLPAPGQSFRVEGTIMQDKQNALNVVIQEVERKTVRPEWLKPVLIGGAALVVVLVVVLFTSMRSKRPATQGAAPAAPPMAQPIYAQPIPSDASGMPMAQPMAMPMAQPMAQPMSPSMPMMAGAASGYGNIATPAEMSPPTIVFDAPVNATQVFLRARLQVTSGADAGKEFPIADSPLHIGRGRTANGGRTNHVVLTDRTVSSAQATIRHDASKDTFSLVNDSVTNRTSVDGEQLDVAALRNGSVIQMGATSMTFHRD